MPSRVPASFRCRARVHFVRGAWAPEHTTVLSGVCRTCFVVVRVSSVNRPCHAPLACKSADIADPIQPGGRGGVIHEIELKLRMTPEMLRRVRGHPVIQSHARGRGRERQLSSTYYDTPDGFLRGAGMALRVRREGKHLVQTLKVPLDTLHAIDLPKRAKAAGRDVSEGADALRGLGSGLQSVAELECTLEVEVPDLDRVTHDGLRRYLHDHGIAERLEALFITTVVRREIPLELEESRIDLALDTGEIRAGDQILPLCEAELELRSGRAGRLFGLALRLSEDLTFQLEADSKAARGHRLLAPGRPGPVSARAPTLASGLSGAEAFDVMARDALAQMRANEPALRQGEDPEGLHQFRVALRRLRALFALFRHHLDAQAVAAVRAELQWLQQATGAARDWDVLLHETLEPMARRMPQEAALGSLVAVAGAARDAASADVRALLDEPRYTRLLLRLLLLLSDGGWRRIPAAGEDDPLASPIERLAGPLLAERAARLNRQGRGWRRKSVEELHTVRISAKKLRYAVDFFRTLYPGKRARNYVANLKEVQDCLGSMNDAANGRVLVDSLAADPLATGMVIGWQAAHVEDDLSRAEAAWKAYRASKPFWTHKPR